jgi:bacillithiol biosynthesis deacetylase BshB1
MKLDILAFAAHPDDVELTMAGTLLLQIQKGRKVGIVDLTQGELGTRGNAELRLKEASKAADLLGIAVRENLGMKDGFISNDEPSRIQIIRMIRKYQPEIIFCNSVADRHPDHGHAAKLVSDATFLSGLSKIQTEMAGEVQHEWRAKALYHYIQDRYLEPDFLVDVSAVWEQRMQAVFAYASQFYDPGSSEPVTPISSREFLAFLEARARDFARPLGVEFAEGFQVQRTIGVNDPFQLI